jgi:hypothetical protein
VDVSHRPNHVKSLVSLILLFRILFLLGFRFLSWYQSYRLTSLIDPIVDELLLSFFFFFLFFFYVVLLSSVFPQIIVNFSVVRTPQRFSNLFTTSFIYSIDALCFPSFHSLFLFFSFFCFVKQWCA